MKKYQKVIYVGRLRPFHKGHYQMLMRAFELGEQVIVVIGSSHQAITPKNPWKAAEVAEMVKGSLSADQLSRIKFIYLRDYGDNDEWINALASEVKLLAKPTDTIGVLGFLKDQSSEYIKSLPWPKEFVEEAFEDGFSATEVRVDLFEMAQPEDALLKHAKKLPKGTMQYLRKWIKTEKFDLMKEDHWYYKDYLADWSVAPYPPVFFTADCLITCQLKGGNQQYILLIVRGKAPGRGNIAMPGGFVNQNEYSFSASLREAKEETSINIPDEEFKEKYYKGSTLVETPTRSMRGRVLSRVHRFDLGVVDYLPSLKPKDDAKEAMWLTLRAFNALEDSCFEDHFSVIKQHKIPEQLPVLVDLVI